MILCLFFLLAVFGLSYLIIWKLFTIELPPSEYKGKAVLVTGCDTGFGRGIALKLNKSGLFKVFAGCLLEKSVNELKEVGSSNLIPFRLDVTKQQDIDAAYELVKKEINSGSCGPLWAVINNAGILKMGLIEASTAQDWRIMFEVNVVGVAMMTQKFSPLLRKSKGSRLINVSSVVGRTAFFGTGAYSASKFAVQGLSDVARRELSPWGVKVVIIEPGVMKTPLYETPFQQSVDAVWNSLSEDMKNDYGRDYFEDGSKKARELVEKLGGDPNTVIEGMWLAVTSKYPPHRIAIGKDTMLWIPISFLPSWLGDIILKLVSRARKPVALK